jgi:hypothetical protein
MRYARIVAVLAIQLCPPLLARTVGAAEGEVRQFVTDLVNAELKPSSSELNNFFAEEFVATNAQGAVLSKSAVIAATYVGEAQVQVLRIRTGRCPNSWERRRHSRHRED